MAKSNNIKGKAFEYAVLSCLKESLDEGGANATVDVSNAFKKARDSFEGMSETAKADYISAAACGIEMIKLLEPCLNAQNETFKLQIQADARGQEGDVRDVVCIRGDAAWEIGFSCKHNHEALKHPRVTNDMDFGSDWVGVPCSSEFKRAVSAALAPVEEWAENGDSWCQHDDVHELVYLPIIQAFVSEIQRLCDLDPSIPGKLLGYFFGIEDFYKIIANDRRSKGMPGATKVMAFNLGGTLGTACGSVKSIRPVRRLKMPSKLFDIRIKDGTKTTLVMTFDENWVISMRLHNADKKVKRTGLKWDVQLKGMPSDMYQQEQPWSCEYGVVKL